ncbi:hypothetical protein EAI_08359, partial [Harpegnathos saltator]
LAASVLKAAMKILGFSVKSKKLKWTYVKVLRDVSAAIAAETTLMVKRMDTSKSGESIEVAEELREENQRLRAEQEAMGKEMDDLRQ